MDIYPPPAPVSETSTYQRLLVPLRSKQTPDKDVVMLSPSPKSGPSPHGARPVFTNDDFIPFTLNDDTRSNKKRRERGEEEATPKPVVNPYQVRPVWVDSSIDVSILSLGAELNHFYQWISLTEEENSLREHAVQLISDIVKSIWPASRVEVFGSHYTKISLPSSDVDLMVYNVTGEEPLSRICHEINEKCASEFVLIKPIPQAKIPVLKLTTKLGEVKLDMCIAVKDEPPNSVKIAQYLSQMPVLRPLVVTLKQFLQQYLLNDTYTGGAGSYLLTLMSISLLQFRENPHSYAFLGTGGNSVSHFGKSQDLGVILLEFFELYGRIFNYHKHGISVCDHGRYFLKQERGWFSPHAPHLLSIEDPSDPDNDVGRGSFNMMQVRLAFFQAFVRLTHPDTERTMPNYRVSSLLTRVIDMDPIYLSRRQRANMIGATLQKKQNCEDDKSDQSYQSDKSDKSERSDKSDKSDDNSYIPSQSVASIMVGDKNLADLDAPTISSNTPFPTSIEIDEKEVEVIDLNCDDPPSDDSPLSPFPLTSNSLQHSIPTLTTSLSSLPSALPRPVLTTSISAPCLSSSSTSTPSPSSTSTSPNASKAYSNGISNVIVNNHSRSPNSHAHFNSNFTSNYNPNFNLNIPKQKNSKPVRPTSTHVNPTTSTTTTTSTSTTNTSTNTNNAQANKQTSKKNNSKVSMSKGERPTGTHLNTKSNITSPSTTLTTTPPPPSNATSAANATNAANATSAVNAANAGGNTSTHGNRNNNAAMFSPGKRRKV